MARAVPDGPRRNRRLAEHFGMAVRDIEHVRDIRNAVAHPGEAIARGDLERAVAIIGRAGRRGAASPRRTNRRRPSPAPRPRAGRSVGRRKSWPLVAVLVVVVVVAFVVLSL
jgi:hypothetical protein